MTSNDFCDLTMGERLQDLMKERKITQSQLANGAGVSQSQISAICRDEERKINHLAIYKICKYLNIYSFENSVTFQFLHTVIKCMKDTIC